MAKDKKKPDWDLSAMDPADVCKGKCGAAWTNDDGTISIRLNPFVELRALDNLKIKLFPAKTQADWDRIKAGEKDSATTPSAQKSSGKFDDLEDDIPF